MTNTEKLTAAYEDAHIQASALLERLQKALHDMPSPEDDINWGHVGSITEVARQLTDILSFVQG